MLLIVHFSYFFWVASFLSIKYSIDGPLIPSNYLEHILLSISFWLGCLLEFIGIEYAYLIYINAMPWYLWLSVTLSITLGFHILLSATTSMGKKEILEVTLVPLALIMGYIFNSIKIGGAILAAVIFVTPILFPNDENYYWSIESGYKIVYSKIWIFLSLIALIEGTLLINGVSLLELPFLI